MDNKYLEKRINNCSFAEFHDMKVESIRMITDGFKEPLVRLMVSRGNVLSEQKAIYAIVKRAHSITKGRPFPSYFSSIELDLECGLLITAEPQTDAPKVETEPADDSLLMENQQLKADVKQLKEENVELGRKLEEMNLLNGESAKIPWHDKVRLELALRFMEKAGCNLEIYGNKAGAARVLEAITKLPPSTCKNYVSNRDLNTREHNEEVLKLNGELQQLGTEIRL